MITAISITERRVNEYSVLSEEIIRQNEPTPPLPYFSSFSSPEEEVLSKEEILANAAQVASLCVEEGVALLKKINRLDDDYRGLLLRRKAPVNPDLIERINGAYRQCFSRCLRLLDLVSSLENCGATIRGANELRKIVGRGVMAGLEESRIRAAATQAQTGRGRPLAEVVNEIRRRNIRPGGRRLR